MKKEISIDFEIGFADSCIQSYLVKNSNIILLLECWNATLLEITFINFASIFSMNYIRIADVKEVFESPLLDRALNELYEDKPEAHSYRIFKLLNSNDMTALEVVCEGIEIKKMG